jgi:hypothetical protein
MTKMTKEYANKLNRAAYKAEMSLRKKYPKEYETFLILCKKEKVKEPEAVSRIRLRKIHESEYQEFYAKEALLVGIKTVYQRRKENITKIENIVKGMNPMSPIKIRIN